MSKDTNTSDGWMGWVAFASIMLFVVGIFHMIAGFVALFKDDVYGVTQNFVWMFDYSEWGWAHILGGLLLFLAAGSLIQGNMYGRIVAVLVALASIVLNTLFVPVYPIWSLMMITIGVLVIWAVTVHGKEISEQV
jgi:hypothetical protein